MISDIRTKIKNKILKDSNGIEESDVTYVLIEIGRIIEQIRGKDNYKTLWFYRNWVAHSELDKETLFIKELKSKLLKISFENGATSNIFGFISFIELKNELIRFSREQVEESLIPQKFFLDSFCTNLKQVIADIPIKIDINSKTVIITLKNDGEFVIDGLLPCTINIELK